MKAIIHLEHEGDTFNFEAISHADTGAMTFKVDDKPIVVNPNGIYELGFMLRRVGSFCKQYADTDFMQAFQEEWYTGHRAKTDE